MDSAGIENYEGHSCYRLHGINNWNKVNDHFYGVQTTHLLDGAAYMFTSPLFDLHNIDNERLTREENAFNVAQAGRSGGRLVAFISVNPLSPSATKEIAYWKRAGGGEWHQALSGEQRV
jgi:hypothetical protein